MDFKTPSRSMAESSGKTPSRSMAESSGKTPSRSMAESIGSNTTIPSDNADFAELFLVEEEEHSEADLFNENVIITTV